MFSRKVTLPSRVPQGYSTIPRPYPRITSHVYNIYETIPAQDTTWYTICAKVIVIVVTYRRVVTGSIEIKVLGISNILHLWKVTVNGVGPCSSI